MHTNRKKVYVQLTYFSKKQQLVGSCTGIIFELYENNFMNNNFKGLLVLRSELFESIFSTTKLRKLTVFHFA